MPPSAYERFRFSFFEDKDSARNGLDMAALRSLEGEERARAEEMLLDYLPDMRGVIGLGELESKRAEPAIAKLLEAERSSGSQYAIPFFAKALWQIRPDARWLSGVLQVLASAGRDDERRNAAEALKAFRDPAAVSALIKALDDPAGLVRHHAACSLLAIHGLPHYSLDWNGQHMVYRVMSENPEIFEGGKKDILASISEKPIQAK